MRASTSLFQYEDEICDEPGGLKKKRLSAEQVGELERCFETENKLEPDRKTKLADQLGLHPRQVAIWFQNKRARWKTKQLEREYGVLRANYNDLKLNFESLLQEKGKLSIEVDQLKRKLKKSEEHNGEDNHREGSDSEASVLDLDNMPIRSFLHSSDQDNTNCYKVNCFPFGNPDSAGSGGDGGSGNVRAPENWMVDQHHFIKMEDHDHGGGFLGGEGGSTIMNFSMGEHNTHSWAWSDHWA